MDKETLSNYGWIVILVLILAVMLALATPFGTFVADAVKSTTAGFFSVNQNAMGAAGINIDKVLFEQCEHDFETTTTASCTQAGVTTNTCKLCGKTETEETPASHTFDNAGDMKCDVCNTTFTAYAFKASDYDAKMGTTTSTDAVVEIPETFVYDGVNYKTTSLAERAYFGCKTINLLTLPDSIQSIGKNCFYACTNLTSINLPESITYIDTYAFAGCNFETITIPSKINRISMDMFSSCYSLKSIVIPDGVTQINSCAFYGCKSLTTIIIPASVTRIDNSAFSECKALEVVNFRGSEEQWNAISDGGSNSYLYNAIINYNHTSK